MIVRRHNEATDIRSRMAINRLVLARGPRARPRRIARWTMVGGMFYGPERWRLLQGHASQSRTPGARRLRTCLRIKRRIDNPIAR